MESKTQFPELAADPAPVRQERDRAPNRSVLPDIAGSKGAAVRFILGGLLTLMLVFFLVMSRWLDSRRSIPDLTIRTLQGISAVDVLAPPPPPPPSEPPPPLKTPPLPKLDISLDMTVPAIKANLDPEVKLEMTMADFNPIENQPRQRMSFSLKELDNQPRLLNKPRVQFPDAMRRRGVKQGRVTLEVEISTSGVPTILRVIESSHDEFVTMARAFAARARFTPPRKDGRAVSARFQWPLILQ